MQNEAMKYRPEIIGNRVKIAVDGTGKSIREVARDGSGIAPNTISNIIDAGPDSNYSPTIKNLYKIAEATNVDIYFLLGEKPPREIIRDAIARISESWNRIDQEKDHLEEILRKVAMISDELSEEDDQRDFRETT